MGEKGRNNVKKPKQSKVKRQEKVKDLNGLLWQYSFIYLEVMMPIYEYECEKCASRFELKRRFDEDVGSPCCPQCQGKVRQLFFPSVILFKGSGCNVTDSRNDRNWQSGEGKADKVETDKKKEGKTDKVEADKKKEGKTDKVEGGKKEEGKADKDQSGKKSESK